jgi:hypothetical protein
MFRLKPAAQAKAIVTFACSQFPERQYTEEQCRPIIHLDSPQQSKEEVAEKVLKRLPVREGLICVLTSARIYPALARHVVEQLGCPDLLRFLG